jgi:hypothetical protein
MGLGVTIDSLKLVGQLVGMIPIAGTYCEKMLGVAAQVCEVAEVRSCPIFQNLNNIPTYHTTNSVVKQMSRSTSNLVIKWQDA